MPHCFASERERAGAFTHLLLVKDFSKQYQSAATSACVQADWALVARESSQAKRLRGCNEKLGLHAWKR